MTELRQKMIRDMHMRRFSERTQETYLRAVAHLAKHYRRSPDLISEDEVRDYLLHLLDVRKLSWSSCNVYTNAIRFFYRVTLGRPRALDLPPRRRAHNLPEILSASEVQRLFAAVSNLKHRVMLMVAYGGGLRLGEIIKLKVTDIDSQRMLIRVEQAKGNKDRYTLLSQRLLNELRAYWRLYRPEAWLFPGDKPGTHVHETVVQKVMTLAKVKAGIRKKGGIHVLRHYSACRIIPRSLLQVASLYRGLHQHPLAYAA